MESIHPKSGNSRNLKSKIRLPSLLEFRALMIKHDIVEHAPYGTGVQRVNLDPSNFAINSNERRQPCGNVYIGCTILDGKSEKFSQIQDLILSGWAFLSQAQALTI